MQRSVRAFKHRLGQYANPNHTHLYRMASKTKATIARNTFLHNLRLNPKSSDSPPESNPAATPPAGSDRLLVYKGDKDVRFLNVGRKRVGLGFTFGPFLGPKGILWVTSGDRSKSHFLHEAPAGKLWLTAISTQSPY